MHNTQKSRSAPRFLYIMCMLQVSVRALPYAHACYRFVDAQGGIVHRSVNREMQAGRTALQPVSHRVMSCEKHVGCRLSVRQGKA